MVTESLCKSTYEYNSLAATEPASPAVHLLEDTHKALNIFCLIGCLL